ncbi:MAG: hypothetical protein ABIU29_01635 [Chthoniobacterales bacterium]
MAAASKWKWWSLLVLVLLRLTSGAAKGNCFLVITGDFPLPDLGAATYEGFQGGFYPYGSNALPAAHQAAGLAQAAQIAR